MEKILIIEDDSKIAAALEVRFRASNFHPLIANDAVQAARMAKINQPDLIILDISLPAGNGLTLAERFHKADATRSVPIIFLTASKDPRLRQRAMELNAIGLFEKPYDIEELIAVIQGALHADIAHTGNWPSERPMAAKWFPRYSRRILIVEDDERIAMALGLRFKAAGYETEVTFDALLGLHSAVRRPPDLLLLDISMPAGNGFVVAERIHKLLSPQPPIIFLTASKRRDIRERAQKLGAAAYFEKPYEATDLLVAVDKILNAQPATA